MTFWRSLEKAQKITLVALAAFVLFLLIFWSVQFKKGLVDPFTYKGDGAKGVATTVDSDETLKQKDTDGDSLSDWDELNIYKTSPYLEDTDSDTVNDSDEIKRGSDPNCPEGKTCLQPDNVAGPNETSSSSSNPLPNLDLSSLQASSSNEYMTKLLAGELDANSLRQVMIEAGFDKQILDNMNDEDLMMVYRESLSK